MSLASDYAALCRRRVLVADDDDMFSMTLCGLLSSRKVDVVRASTLTETIERAQEVDSILLDIYFDGEPSLPLIPEIIERCRSVYLMTGARLDAVDMAAALDAGVTAFLRKPQDFTGSGFERLLRLLGV